MRTILHIKVEDADTDEVIYNVSVFFRDNKIKLKRDSGTQRYENLITDLKKLGFDFDAISRILKPKRYNVFGEEIE